MLWTTKEENYIHLSILSLGSEMCLLNILRIHSGYLGWILMKSPRVAMSVLNMSLN